MPKWTMPQWMEPFRTHLTTLCGGCHIEDLMNDHTTTIQTNPTRGAFCLVSMSLVKLLELLHNDGSLRS